MNTRFKHLLAMTAASAALLAAPLAQADTGTTPSDQGTLTKEQAHDMKTESKAEYKARKKVADAQHDLDTADCKTAGLDSKNERDCKHDAKQAAKGAKDDAKQIYDNEKADIKARKE